MELIEKRKKRTRSGNFVTEFNLGYVKFKVPIRNREFRIKKKV